MRIGDENEMKRTLPGEDMNWWTEHLPDEDMKW